MGSLIKQFLALKLEKWGLKIEPVLFFVPFLSFGSERHSVWGCSVTVINLLQIRQRIIPRMLHMLSKLDGKTKGRICVNMIRNLKFTFRNRSLVFHTHAQSVWGYQDVILCSWRRKPAGRGDSRSD